MVHIEGVGDVLWHTSRGDPFGGLVDVQRLLRHKGRQQQCIPGLPNLGNTCFMNAVLQCLLNTPGDFLGGLLELAYPGEPSGSDGVTGPLLARFTALAAEYSLADGALPQDSDVLRDFKEAVAVSDSRFAGCRQQDADEFLGSLLDALDSDLARLLRARPGPRVPPGGFVRQACGVGLFTSRQCRQCLRVSLADRAVDTALRLPLLSPAAQLDGRLRLREEQTAVSLQALLLASQQPEEIQGYDCDGCRAIAQKAGVAHQRSTVLQRAGLISTTSDVLVITLYRFLNVLDDDDDEFSAIKVRRRVAIPTRLSLDTGDYTLYGVVSHLGSSLSSGHYIAAVRSARDQQWYECDDEQVRPLLLRSLYEDSEITATRPDADPYILFYHRTQLDMEFVD